VLAALGHAVADKVQGWPELSLRKLVHELVKFLAHRAHKHILRSEASGALNVRRLPILAWTGSMTSAPVVITGRSSRR
jgi:hypothetical protein